MVKTLISKIKAWFGGGVYTKGSFILQEGRQITVIEYKRLKTYTLKEIWHLTKSKVCAILKQTKKRGKAMDRFNPNVGKNFELKFTMLQYGNEYTVHIKYWHSEPPDMDLGMGFFLSAMKLLGWEEDDVAYYFYDIINDRIERERKENKND